MEGAQAGSAAGLSPTRLAWVCGSCQRECVPIRGESRCLCGHRYKEHDAAHSWRCTCGGCACPRFFLIVAQGAWVLRCRCKHKHVEHDAASRACSKRGCDCAGFDSPWVCNCDHAWADHAQQEAAALPSSGVVAMLAAAAQEIETWQSVQRGAARAGPG